MNNLQMQHLLNFCRHHELDTHLIDKTLTYSENKKYLETLVPDFSPERNMAAWQCVEAQYKTEHPLWNYMMSSHKTKPEDVGEALSTPQQFSLKDQAHIGFSLRRFIAAKTK